MQVQPYLTFNGRCEEALEFYRKTLGAKVQMVMRFKDAPQGQPQGQCAPGTSEKIMHSCLRIGESAVMASDGMSQDGKPTFSGFALSLTAADDAEAARRFAALADGGKVQMPLGKSFFASSFGVVADRFGVSWMVIVPRDGMIGK